MRPELEELNSRLDAMSREELILSIRRLMEENSEKEAILEINSSAATEMSIQFQQIKDENTALKKENKELLRLIGELPPGFRTVFNMYVLEGYSHKEIGEALGITENTSRSQLQRARTLLQSKIRDLTDDR